MSKGAQQAYAQGQNPIIGADFPDVDVIRVDDSYYMLSTTMYFMPGGVILRSFDLIHWEIYARLYDRLDSTPAQRLISDQNIYAQGMWAPSLRAHKGKYYACFAANDTRKTYLFVADDMAGPWEKQTIEGFYHDSSLLFDDDGRVYLIYGNSEIRALELKEDLSGPKPGGLSRVLVKEEGNPRFLNYEGTHAYKLFGRYYLFMIHSLSTHWKRTQACYIGDSLEGDFQGRDILNDDMGYFDQGIAQGGVVQAPDGSWFSILFQDRGAVGRIPVVIPMRFAEDGFPVLGEDGKVPVSLRLPDLRPGHQYQPLYCSDDFRYPAGEGAQHRLKAPWEWNHEPDDALWSLSARPGALRITTGKTTELLTQAQNTLTQRCMEPACEAVVTVDGGGMLLGDRAGLCALISGWAQLALCREQDGYHLRLYARQDGDDLKGSLLHSEAADGPVQRIKLRCAFGGLVGQAQFYVERAGAWRPFGDPHPLHYTLKHFTGTRFGLFTYATQKAGGYADFLDFGYEVSGKS